MQSMPKMPAIYISKYNRFVDNIVGRINRILGKSYDPVRVKLQSNEAKSKNNKRKKSNKRRNSVRRNSIKNKMGNLSIARNKMEEVAIARSTESESREPAFILISKAGESSGYPIRNVTVNTETRAAPTRTKTKSKKKSNRNKTGNKKTSTKKTTTKPTTKKSPKARATLFGLSSIKREGDVIVNMMSDHTTVKSNFVLGPLTLRVEREVIWYIFLLKICLNKVLFVVWQRSKKRAEERHSNNRGNVWKIKLEDNARWCGHTPLHQSAPTKTGNISL